METSTLRQRWLALFATREIQAAQCFDALCQRYAEAHRHYHTLAHIKACLGWLDTIRPALSQARQVELALWFHDAIYDPRRRDCEALSAQLAKQQLEILGEPTQSINRVAQLIELTRHPATPGDDDERYLLDIDLAILGAPAAQYDAYEQAIRQEYRHVPGWLYRFGRRRLLKCFLQQPSLYQTAFFAAQWEAQAQQNMRRAR